jgi:hypothetical protein
MRLPAEYQFIKKQYILNKTGICCKLGVLYDVYAEFCRGERLEPIQKIEFHRKLKEIGIFTYDSCGYKKVKISYESLKSIADTKHWLHELDEPTTDGDSEDDDEDYDNGIKKSEDDSCLLRKQLQDALDRVKYLENQLKDKVQIRDDGSFPAEFKKNIMNLLMQSNRIVTPIAKAPEELIVKKNTKKPSQKQTSNNTYSFLGITARL